MTFDPKEARALVERLDGYTPGPWTFEMEQGEWPDHALIGGDGDPVLSFDFDLGFRVNDANATLIAAAPDLHATLTAALDRIEALEAQQENAAQAMAETHNSWEARCYAIMAMLEQDFGGFSTDAPDVGSWYEINSRRLQKRIEELEAEADALLAEIARLREDRDDALATLDAWFDRRNLAHDKIDSAVLDAARGYLRTSRSGGMSQSESDMIEGVIEDMARLSVFADLFARAALKGADQ